MDKTDFFRNAIIESNSDKSVLEVLKTSLPEGYSLENRDFDNREYTLIKTPSNDAIILTTENLEYDKQLLADKKVLRTGNILNQDRKNIQPSLADDELTKLKHALKENNDIHIDIIAAEADLKTKPNKFSS